MNEREPAPLAAMLDFTGEGTTDIDDIVIGTKIRLVPEGAGRPAFGVRFATKLPNASNESGLGTDSMDFYVVGSRREDCAIDPDRRQRRPRHPRRSDPRRRAERRADLRLLGGARGPPRAWKFVGEINGRQSLHPAEEVPVGTESRSIVRIGGTVHGSTVRVDGGVLFGLTSRDPSFGFTAGVTWVFRGFTIP